MKKIDAYIGSTVFLAMSLVLLVFAGLDFIFTVFDEMGDTGGTYGISYAFTYVLLTMPRHLYELLPWAALVGALIGLGILASSHELVVMQSAGVRVGRIVWAVMKQAVLVMVVGLLLGEFIAPPLELLAEVGRAVALGREATLLYGYWQKDSDQFVHFTAMDAQGVLHGVTIYTYDANHQPAANLVAERAVFQPRGKAGGYWLLEDVFETEFHRREGEVLSFQKRYAEKPWEVDLTPDLLRVLILDADKLAISDLYRYANYFASQGQDAAPYYLSFWRKVMQPVTTAVLVLVAVSFVFGPLREATMGSRLFVAICFGLVFFLLQRLLNTVSLVFQLDPLAAVLAPILLSALVGWVLLKRAV